jgi:hypothetical protein
MVTVSLGAWLAAYGIFSLWRVSRRARQPDRDAPTLDTIAEDDEAALPMTGDESGAPKTLARRRRRGIWWRTDAYVRSLDEAKTPCSKIQSILYNRLVPARARAASTVESGHEQMVNWIVSLRFLVDSYALLLAICLFLVPIVLLFAEIGTDWTLAIAQKKGLVSPDRKSATEFAERYKMSGIERLIPQCAHYDRAVEIFQEELRSDDAHKVEAHSRCVLRTDRDVHALSATDAELSSAPTVYDIVSKTGYEHVAADTNPDFSNDAPLVYVLHDGERYFRAVARPHGGERMAPRMISESAVLKLLANWTETVKRRSLDARLYYCVSPVYLGLLGDMVFYYETAASRWHVWLAPRVESTQELSSQRSTRARYSAEVSGFVHAQHERIMARVGPNASSVRHHDGVTVSYVDAQLSLRVPEDVDAVERYWLGHPTAGKRAYDLKAPFALAVPLRTRTQMTLTGPDTACIYTQLHILGLIKELKATV